LSKYNSKKVEYDGIVFDSQIEMEYFKLLKDRVNKEEILWFTIQPVYELTPKFTKGGKNIRSTSYTPDFLIKHLDGSLEAIETKGFMTQASELRIKLFNYRYQDIKLTVLSYSKKWGGWVEYSELKKLRRENKKII